MGVHIEPRPGQVWADRHKESTGREVKILEVLPDGSVLAETVKAADAAVTAKAVGRVTTIRHLHARFAYVKDGESA